MPLFEGFPPARGTDTSKEMSANDTIGIPACPRNRHSLTEPLPMIAAAC